jgi:ABC-2 type transport system ATP-binding protein
VTKSFYNPGGPDAARFLRPWSRPARRDVLVDVNLEVAPGTIVGLVGANGAGKTTLLEILCTLLLPTSGEAFVHGHNVTGDPAAVKRLVGYCPAGFDTFYPRLSAVSNLEFFAALNGFSRGEGRRRLDAACEMAGVNGSRHLEFQRHSSGMKQRLVLARALMTDPSVLLLDEPARSLDLASQGALWQLVREALVGKLHKTVLLVTHNLAEVREVCDRVAILHGGRIVDVAAPSQLTDARVGEILDRQEEAEHAAR